MTTSRIERVILFLGDIVCLFLALWLALFLRYRAVPNEKLFIAHLFPFSVLFLVWLLVFFIFGLYEKQTTLFKQKLPTILLNAQFVNSVLAALFFYFIPYFGIAPKTNLFLDLALSLILVVLWRLFALIAFERRKPEEAIVIATGSELEELSIEVNNNQRYGLKFIDSIDLNIVPVEKVRQMLHNYIQKGVTTVVLDTLHPHIDIILPELYNFIFSEVHFIQFHSFYEAIFDRIALSSVSHGWFLENISTQPKLVYDTFKRLSDFLAGIALTIFTFILYPFIYIAIKLNDGGPIFISQIRVGQHGKPIKIYKFRSMAFNDAGDSGKGKENKITAVGKFLRKTRLDEFPQSIGLITGQLSLIGPRPELPLLTMHYEKEIAYYKVRHLIKPGLTGWAQVYHENHPHHVVAVDETREKLSYDLFYLKNRSFLLDLKIALQTLKIFMIRSGR